MVSVQELGTNTYIRMISLGQAFYRQSLKFSSLVIEDINILTAVLRYTDHIITKEGRVVSAGKGIRVKKYVIVSACIFQTTFCYFLSIFYSV